jgi:hypothetical protein
LFAFKAKIDPKRSDEFMEILHTSGSHFTLSPLDNINDGFGVNLCFVLSPGFIVRRLAVEV